MDVANMDVDEGVLSHRCICVCMFVYVCMCTNRYFLEAYNLGAKNLHTATCACLHAFRHVGIRYELNLSLLLSKPRRHAHSCMHAFAHVCRVRLATN